MALAGRLNLLNAKSTCCLLVGIWAYAFWPSIQNAFHTYIHSGSDYQGFLVFPILLLIMMRNSPHLKRTTAIYSPAGLFYLLFFATIWLFATILELDIPRQIAIISMLIAIVLTTCGKKVTSILLLPFSCFFLLLPIGQQVYTEMQHAFAWALMQALLITKQAMYWEGGKIFANNHAYDIQAYLGAMKHMLAFLTLGAAYAMLRTRAVATTIYIASSFVIMPFVTLWVVLFCYIVLNQIFSMHNIIENHSAAIGWSLTLIGLGQAALIGVFLADRKNIIARTDDIAWRDNFYAAKQKILKPLVMASCIILLMPIISQNLKKDISNSDPLLPNIPTTIAEWKRPGQDVTKKTLATSFKKDQNLVNLAISHNAQPLDKSWKKIKESKKKIKLSQQKMPVHETVFHNNKNKYKINWSVNYVNGHFTTNPAVAKALTQLYNLSKKDVKCGVITISTDATAELSLARDRLKEFLQDFTESDVQNIQKG